MGVHTIYDPEHEKAAMYCSVTGVAFGPTFDDESPDGPDDCEMLNGEGLCELFQEWLGKDARRVKSKDLEEAYTIFIAARRDGMYPKIAGDGCRFCGQDIGHHDICPEKT